jgi:DNA-binding NarL/FixJ family response regulator
MIRVLIADDHALVREGIRRILVDSGDIDVVAEAGNTRELVELGTSKPLDVVVMDLSMPDSSGLDAISRIHATRPDLPLLVLTMHPADQYAVRALGLGASGFLNKEAPPTELIEAIRNLRKGRRHITPHVAALLANHVDSDAQRLPHETLSNREFQVMRMLGTGLSVTEIARDLSLSVKTISTFRTRVLRKLNFRSNADMVRYLLEQKLMQ